jgi:hypothetical protein
VYLATIVLTSEWRRLVPTSWSIVPAAWDALLTYASLRLPAGDNRYNALQLTCPPFPAQGL